MSSRDPGIISFWCRRQPHAARSGIFVRFPLRLSHLRHMDMPYGTLPDPVQAVFIGIAPGQVIAATAFLPASMTDCFAAWRARPSVPDTWDGFQPCGILHTVGAAAALPPPPPCEGGRNEIKWERRAYTPTLPLLHTLHFALPFLWEGLYIVLR